MKAWQRRNAEFAASHPIAGAVLIGGGWGLLFWLGFGLANHALNLTLFVIAMADGLLLVGPLMVWVIRRRLRSN
jgi:hypothetical protein